jgi:hypothetical protein
MPMPQRPGQTAMDRWLTFNLEQLAGEPVRIEEVL